jgi:signal transduction histidine kinase
MLRALSKLLLLAKESYNQPTLLESADIVQDLKLQSSPIAATSGRTIRVESIPDIGPVTLTKRSHAALINIAVNLLHNATQNSPPLSEVSLRVEREGANLVLAVENVGAAISSEVVRGAQAKGDTTPSFRGLPRSYQLAARNNWQLEYKFCGGTNRFTLTVGIHS